MRDPSSQKGQKSQSDLNGRPSVVDSSRTLMRLRAKPAQTSFPPFTATYETSADSQSLQWKQQVEAEQPGVLKDDVFHSWRLESRSVHHKCMSNHKVLSSSNIMQAHAKCVGYIWPLLADQELDKTSGAEIEFIWGHLLFFFLPMTLCWLVCVPLYSVHSHLVWCIVQKIPFIHTLYKVLNLFVSMD